MLLEWNELLRVLLAFCGVGWTALDPSNHEEATLTMSTRYISLRVEKI
jgi:hypothetical protein